MTDDYTDIEIDAVIRVTAGAVLVQYGERQEWIPKSVITDVDLVIEPPHGEPQTIGVQTWFAVKEDLAGVDE